MQTISQIIARLSEVQHQIDNASAMSVNNGGFLQLLTERYSLAQELAGCSGPIMSGATKTPRVFNDELQVARETSLDMEPKALGQINDELQMVEGSPVVSHGSW